MFFERLRRLFFRVKVRLMVKKKKEFAVKVPFESCTAILLCFQAPITKQFVEVHVYYITKAAAKQHRTYKFLFRKQLFENEEPDCQRLRSLFYVSESCCLVSPVRPNGRHYIRWLVEIQAVEKHPNLMYNLYSERGQFFLEIFRRS